MRLFILTIAALGFLASCSTDNYPLEDSPPAKEAPRPIPELPPTTPPEPVRDQKWIPHDYDIMGGWMKDCTPVVGEPGKFVREEIRFFHDARIALKSNFYSDPVCSVAAGEQPSELVFEEGWEAVVVSLSGTFLPGWRGLFLKEAPGTTTEAFEVSVSLAEESGKRVMFIKWQVERPVHLDAVLDRYVQMAP